MARKRAEKKTRAGNGEGSIRYNAATNKWEYQFSFKDEYGKTKRKWVNGETPEDCEKRKEEILKRKGLSKDKSVYTIPDILIMLYDDRLDDKEITDSTYVRKMYTVDTIRKSNLGEIPIIDITPEDIILFKKAIIHSDRSASSTEKEWTSVSRALEEAIRRNIIESNPLKDERVRAPKFNKEDAKEIRAFSIEEENAFVEALEKYVPKGGRRNYYKYQFLIELLCGARMGEINALTIDDVDFKNNCINIRRTVTKSKEIKPVLGAKTKTKKGTRKVPMNDKLKIIMQEVVNNYVPNKDKLLFPNLSGKSNVISTSEVNAAFKRICKNAGIEEYGQHMLRHTFATRCVERDVPVEVLSYWLGHRNIQTTMRYVDEMVAFEEKALNKLNDYGETIRFLS